MGKRRPSLLIANVLQIARANRKEVKRFVKFAMVGAAGSITDFTVLNVLIQAFGAPLVLANTASFIAAVMQNFSLNRRWTFPESRGRQAGGQLASFVLVSVIGLGINQIVFLTLHHFWEQLFMAAWGDNVGFILSYNVAKLFAIGVVLFWNFSANRLWTYRGL
jgi:putative flippase GtrA